MSGWCGVLCCEGMVWGSSGGGGAEFGQERMLRLPVAKQPYRDSELKPVA